MSEPAKNETENTTRPRLSSLSNRFEVEKVDEKPPPIPPIPPIDDEALDNEKAKQDEQERQQKEKTKQEQLAKEEKKWLMVTPENK